MAASRRIFIMLFDRHAIGAHPYGILPLGPPHGTSKIKGTTNRGTSQSGEYFPGRSTWGTTVTGDNILGDGLPSRPAGSPTSGERRFARGGTAARYRLDNVIHVNHD